MIDRTYKKILNRHVCIRASQVILSRRIRHPSKLGGKFDKARAIRESARTSRRYDSALQPISDVGIHFHRDIRSHGN